LIANGKAPHIVQPEEGATYDKIWKKKDVAKVNRKKNTILTCSDMSSLSAICHDQQ